MDQEIQDQKGKKALKQNFSDLVRTQRRYINITFFFIIIKVTKEKLPKTRFLIFKPKALTMGKAAYDTVDE